MLVMQTDGATDAFQTLELVAGPLPDRGEVLVHAKGFGTVVVPTLGAGGFYWSSLYLSSRAPCLGTFGEQ